MRIVLGVTGGIAAYKATTIIRQLTEAGHSVQVVPTQNALRFIGATTLEALSHHTVDTDLYSDVADVKHVQIGQNAELIIIAPATASFLARYASGLADDLLGNTLLATKAPVLVAPAMHTEMWQHPATVANVATLRARGVAVLDPASGRLTGQDTGPGRLPEADEIIAAAFKLLVPQDLAGRKIVITAGGTQEAIDPVRYIGNKSSGKQGLAIARAANARGAQVTLIGANIGEFSGEVFDFVSVVNAAELQEAVETHLSAADVLVMAAAVSDYRVQEVSDHKLKRGEIGDEINLHLVANPDILRAAVTRISAEKLSTVTVGFAAETAGSHQTLLTLAKTKLTTKGCDILVANDVSAGAIFGQDTTSVALVTRSGSSESFEGTKTFVADRILDAVVTALA